MLIPPFAIFLLLRPRNLDALQHQHQPTPNLLASSIQVLSWAISAFYDIRVINYLDFLLQVTGAKPSGCSFSTSKVFLILSGDIPIIEN